MPRPRLSLLNNPYHNQISMLLHGKRVIGKNIRLRGGKFAIAAKAIKEEHQIKSVRALRLPQSHFSLGEEKVMFLQGF